jgi:hypothetical protein
MSVLQPFIHKNGVITCTQAFDAPVQALYSSEPLEELQMSIGFGMRNLTVQCEADTKYPGWYKLSCFGNEPVLPYNLSRYHDVILHKRDQLNWPLMSWTSSDTSFPESLRVHVTSLDHKQHSVMVFHRGMCSVPVIWSNTAPAAPSEVEKSERMWQALYDKLKDTVQEAADKGLMVEELQQYLNRGHAQSLSKARRAQMYWPNMLNV